MKIPNVLIFLILISGCRSDPIDTTLSCNLILDYGSNRLTVSIISKHKNIYLSPNSSLTIYKKDNSGNYLDWTDSFYQNSLVLLDQKEMNSTSGLNSISRFELNKLKEEFIEKYMANSDSIEYLSIQEQIEIKLAGILLLNKSSEHLEVIDLYPLEHQGGCFKLVYKHFPKDHVEIGAKSLKLPKVIDVYKRWGVPFKSNEIYICY